MAETKQAKEESSTLTEREKLLIPTANPAYHMTETSNEIARDIAENRRVLLTGHMGCGKTTTFTELAARINQPLIRANLNGQTSISDLLGCWQIKNKETYWMDGILTMAVREGWWLVLDELDSGEPPVISVVNQLAERNGVLILKEKDGEILVPHPKFRLLATANTVGRMEQFRHLYQGTNIMNRALLDRFRCYYVPYLKPDVEEKVLLNSVEGLNQKTANMLVDMANSIRTGFENEDLSSTFSTRQLIDFAELLVRKKKNLPESNKDTITKAILECAEVIIYSKISQEDTDVISTFVSKLLPNGAASR